MKKAFILPDLDKARRRTAAMAEIDRSGIKTAPGGETVGAGKTYYIRNHGCQANFHDGETIAGILEAVGYQPAAEIRDADLVIINTCAVRENAEERVFGEIGSLKQGKTDHPERIIAVGGCMMQEPKAIELILSTYPQIDLVFGIHNISRLPSLIYQVMQKRQRLIEVPSEEGRIYEALPAHRLERHKAYVSIMEGCDKFCTYCIVPYTRGKQRSRLPEDILGEIRGLISEGCREITLLGQNVNAYGKDRGAAVGFAQLLGLAADTGIERVRFMTSHPWDFTPEMISVIGERRNIMPYIHLPAQSGSDRILRQMGRRYTAGEYLRLYEQLKAAKPGAAFSTDLIVGFPGESEEDFQATLSLYERCRFDSAFTFAYSPRPGTPAASFPGQVEETVKRSRLARLNERAAYWGSWNNQKYLDTTVQVLVDGPSKKDPAVFSGYSETMKLVNFRARNAVCGQIIPVRVTEAKSWTLNGKQV